MLQVVSNNTATSSLPQSAVSSALLVLPCAQQN